MKPTPLSYNVLQRVTYLPVIFVLFPIVIWTGLAISPAFDSALPWAVNVLGGRQSARTMHFFVSDFSRAVFHRPRRDGRSNWIRESHAGDDHGSPLRPGAHMSKISRRKFVTPGSAATAGVSGLAVAASFAQRYGLVPPDSGGIYGPAKR